MKQTRTKKQSEPASNISSLVNKSHKIENQRVLQDNIIAVEGSDHTDHHLAGVKVLHGGLDKVAEGGTVVLTIKDQPILADGDLNKDVDILENVEIGEQKRRDHAYKAAKKTSIYDDKFNDDPSAEKKILPKYDDSAAEESLTLDERGRFSGEAEKKLEELQRRPIEMLQFKKSKKKKSLRKKDKLDINALEAESISLGLDVGDLGWRKDAKRKTIQDEQERLARNNAYQFAYAKAVEACKLLRQEQSRNVKSPVFADDDEDLRKSLEKARRLALKNQEEKGVFCPQAIAVIASSNPCNETVDDQISTARKSRENKIVFREIKESCSQW
ncbi:unnamed protein product [Trifolium pratense]|uniref:Uncharacterized protein n=1 Tax=Trifolium pratense TaxID=57577 RepID=A0ACB0K3L7_TRIPR|nr:unnamed protein product [Trifolium pratense]